MSPFRVTERSTKLRRLRKTTRRSRVHVQTVGLNAETKKVSAPSRRGDISLDIRFYRTSPTEKQRLQFRFHGVVDFGGCKMPWARMLAYITGIVDQELLPRNSP
jgi:hypothetical protein